MDKIRLGEGKLRGLKSVADSNGIISALAIDQRGSLKKMIALGARDPGADHDRMMEDFKIAVCEELTPFCSSILLDPEYGIPASSRRASNAGLLLAYEKTGYDASRPGRLPDLLDDYSVYELKRRGADAIKFLIYYDVDEDKAINDRKHIFLQRLGSECLANDIPLFVEPISYDAGGMDPNSMEFARVKPRKVIDTMYEFSKPEYYIDVLKMEVPVNMSFVEGFAKDMDQVVYSREEARGYFQKQSQATHLPFIFLSAGVSAEMFRDTILFARESGSGFNGVLCGRATWKDGVKVFAENGDDSVREWLRVQGKTNVNELNLVLNKSASSIFERVAA